MGSTGSIWALNGVTGATIWHTATAGQVIGSAVSADLTGGGYQDAIVPTTAGVQIFDGKSGADGGHAGPECRVRHSRSSPLVTDDPNGSLGITVAGYNSGNQGVIQHYELGGINGAKVERDRGMADVPSRRPTDRKRRTPSPVVEVPCNAPRAGPVGYDMTASDGGMFNYGNLPFCGSTGSLFLKKPVVGIATPMTVAGTGWWRPTAGSSPSATRPSTARRGTSP